MKSKKEFDSTMLYPFFAEKEPGERFLSSVLSKKVVIEELVPLNLDPIMGRLSCGLGLLLNDGGKGIRMIIYIKDKGIEEKNSTALMTVGGLMDQEEKGVSDSISINYGLRWRRKKSGGDRKVHLF